ncbi:MAG: hypothetical protein AAFX99_28850, partial [Myxococcota bacterium]
MRMNTLTQTICTLMLCLSLGCLPEATLPPQDGGLSESDRDGGTSEPDPNDTHTSHVDDVDTPEPDNTDASEPGDTDTSEPDSADTSE